MRTNDEVAALLAEYADLLAITGGDAFRIRSYEKAARSVGGYPEDLARVDPAELDQIPNVGRAIAAKIRDYLGTGQIRQLEALRAKVPAGVRRLTEVPGLGPKRAMSLFTERGIDSVDALEAAIAAGRLEGLAGFGPKSGENLLRGIELIRKSAGRIRIDTAMDLAAELITQAVRRARLHPLRLRGIAAPDARHDRRRGHPRGGRGPGRADGRVPGVAAGSRGHRQRRRQDLDPDRRRRSRPTCGSSRRTAGARPCSTSPGRRRTTSGSARWPWPGS